MIRLLLLVGFVFGCEIPPVPDVPLSEETLATLRSQVKEVIRPECGSCHTSTLPTAKPAAVGVFDLVRADWSVHMTEKQLDGFRLRTRDLADSLVARVDSLLMGELAKYVHPPTK